MLDEAITYSLRNIQADSGQYYQNIASFTDEVLDKAASLEPLKRNFQASLSPSGLSRDPLEIPFELLLLGTIWRVYGGRALSLSTLPRLALTGLSNLRDGVPSLKRGIDGLRGILETLFLSPFHSLELFQPTLPHLDALLGWLSATGEFKQEVSRFRDWRNYWGSLSPTKAGEEMEAVLGFASWFEDRCEQVLGSYTLPLERFLEEKYPKYRWREDLVACGRKRVEYHANMVGAEILNRAYREAFLRQPKREVLLPSCMCNHPEQCRAKESPLGLRCTGCDSDCRVHQLRNAGAKKGFGVILMKHQSSLFRGWPAGEIAIVGVACVSTLIGGGLKAKASSIPAQCVLLDHCGCRSHWHESGIKTDINLAELYHLLEIDDLKESA